MRENRLYGSEGGAGVLSLRSYPYRRGGNVKHSAPRRACDILVSFPGSLDNFNADAHCQFES